MLNTIEMKSVALIGAGFAGGQQFTGVMKAPDMLRDAGCVNKMKSLGWEVHDEGNLQIVKEPDGWPSSGTYYQQNEILSCPLVGAQNGLLFEHVKSAAEKGHFVVVLGGDHGIASGSIAGMLVARPEICVVWVDAHGDCNTPETSPSKNYHGMPVAHLLGWFKKRAPGFEWMESAGGNGRPVRLEEDRLSLIGLRDLDEYERRNIVNSQVAAYSMQHLDEDGISKVVDSALQKIDPHSTRPIHLSLDIDACDPSIAPGTGTRARGGLTYREVHYIVEKLSSTGRLVSMDLVEINPDIEGNGKETVTLGLELVASALGKTIL